MQKKHWLRLKKGATSYRYSLSCLTNSLIWTTSLWMKYAIFQKALLFGPPLLFGPREYRAQDQWDNAYRVSM